MATVKKCDRCGCIYPFDYRAKHVEVGVYHDNGKELRPFDLCPECDKAAAEWMRIKVGTMVNDDISDNRARHSLLIFERSKKL